MSDREVKYYLILSYKNSKIKQKMINKMKGKKL